MALAKAADVAGANAVDAPLAALHRDLFCEANPIPVKWALAKMGKVADSIRSPLVSLGAKFHARVESALQTASLIDGEPASGSEGWPSRDLLLQGHLFDQSLINQALDIIERLVDERLVEDCLLYTSPSPRDATLSRMPSSA